MVFSERLPASRQPVDSSGPDLIPGGQQGRDRPADKPFSVGEARELLRRLEAGGIISTELNQEQRQCLRDLGRKPDDAAVDPNQLIRHLISRLNLDQQDSADNGSAKTLELVEQSVRPGSRPAPAPAVAVRTGGDCQNPVRVSPDQVQPRQGGLLVPSPSSSPQTIVLKTEKGEHGATGVGLAKILSLGKIARIRSFALFGDALNLFLSDSQNLKPGLREMMKASLDQYYNSQDQPLPPDQRPSFNTIQGVSQALRLMVGLSAEIIAAPKLARIESKGEIARLALEIKNDLAQSREANQQKIEKAKIENRGKLAEIGRAHV